MLGTPSARDISKIENDKARNYLRGLPPKPAIDFVSRFPGADPRAVELLTHLLTFDPDIRYTAEQALAHPYLQELRVEPEERVYEGSCVDFAFEDIKGQTKEDMRELIIGEILLDNSHLTREQFTREKDRVREEKKRGKRRQQGAAAAEGTAANATASLGKRSREEEGEEKGDSSGVPIEQSNSNPMEATAQRRRLV